MKNSSGMKNIIAMLGMILALLVMVQPAAARSFTVQELNTPQPVEVTMGDPAGTTLNYRITNTSTGADVNRSIYRLIFTAPAGYTFTGAPTLPAGWAISGTPGQTITLLTSSTNPCTNCIVSTGAGGAAKDFDLTLGAIPASTQDTVSTVSVQARFNNFKNTTNNGQIFVTRRSLKAALVAYLPAQCAPDCTNWGATCSAAPSISIGATHGLTIIIQNKSTATWIGIISNPNPPTAVYSWAGGGPAFTAPATITLTPGACNVVTWVVTMPGGKTGTIYYQARARNSTGVATSLQATSNTVTVAALAASIGQTCVFPGEISTVTTTATNNGASALTNIRPWGISTTLNGNHNNSITTINVASTVGFPSPAGTIRIDAEDLDYTGTTATTFTGCVRDADKASHNNNTPVYGPLPFFIGTAAPAIVTGPTPSTIANLGAGSSGTFTWTYGINGIGGQTYSFQGLASAGAAQSTVVSSVTGTLGYFNVAIGTGATQGVGTFNNVTAWNVTNNGCFDVNRVDIQVPGGFTVPNDGFDADTGVDPPNWNANYAGGIVSFTSGTNMVVGQAGVFSILFTALPGTGVYPFPMTVYDTFGRIVPVIPPPNVTVDTSIPGGGTNKSWEETIR